MASERESIEAQLKREEARLSELSLEQADARARVDQLRLRLVELGGSLQMEEAGPQHVADSPATPTEKIALFRSLFRGRGDVFPRLWVNNKKGKQGYSPACSNEWVRGSATSPR